MQIQVMINNEVLWIELVKEKNDSTALNNLVKRYRPMIDNMYIQYFIDGYDRKDWYQEAFIVCYNTCKFIMVKMVLNLGASLS
ncbi:hypothetical protein COSHB9_15240 [Companilactobacillus alimentarius]|uniref:hypothetical protein n=2 Tax=Companilactobacillus alimentarius TaxID=1602 RepID=UPI0011BE4931|nr:hypothetical protein [Companilactobacillus alimentarius]